MVLIHVSKNGATARILVKGTLVEAMSRQAIIESHGFTVTMYQIGTRKELICNENSKTKTLACGVSS